MLLELLLIEGGERGEFQVSSSRSSSEKVSEEQKKGACVCEKSVLPG